ACGVFLPGYRSVDERDGDPFRHRFEQLPQHVCDAEGLESNRLQLVVDGRVGVGTVVDEVRALLAQHQPRAMELLEFPPALALAAADGADDFGPTHSVVW